MKKLLLALILTALGTGLRSQSLYFPPLVGNAWDTLSPASLGWCPDKVDSLMDYLELKNTKAFILLKDGKIVLEEYFGTFTQDSLWYWASAGKTLTSFLVGIAQQEGELSISDTTSQYLGQGWTACTPAQEEKITIRHQLTMTSGLDDGVPDHYCTLDTCLTYLADAGTRWAYHNGPYTLLDGVIENATGQTLNSYATQKLKTPTGMTGTFITSGYNNVFISKARSMARFGLLILNRGNWNGNQLMTDTAYFNEMTSTSQALNPSYGYLWWLNGKPSFMLPGLQFTFPSSLNPHAPNDMIAALGKNGQFINVVPSQNLVFIRLGNVPDVGDVPAAFNDSIWMKLNGLACATATQPGMEPQSLLQLLPNPAQDFVRVEVAGQRYELMVLDLQGRLIDQQRDCFGQMQLSTLSYPDGLYQVRVRTEQGRVLNQKLLICR